MTIAPEKLPDKNVAERELDGNPGMLAKAVSSFRPDVDFRVLFQDPGEVGIQSAHQFVGPLNVGLLDGVHALVTYLHYH